MPVEYAHFADAAIKDIETSQGIDGNVADLPEDLGCRAIEGSYGEVSGIRRPLK
jgi:hypothetical protein